MNIHDDEQFVGQDGRISEKPPQYHGISTTPPEVVENPLHNSPYGTYNSQGDPAPWSPTLSHAGTHHSYIGSTVHGGSPYMGHGGDDGDKEVYQESPPPQQVPSQEKQQKRVCGLRRRWFWSFVIIFLLLVIGLAVGLGVGLGMNSSSSNKSSSSTDGPCNGDAYCIGGALNPDYYSTSGAFNGSGIALASQSFGTDTQGTIVTYFQHHTGDIRWEQLGADGWQGGSESEIVTSDAKNGTPISAVAYAINGTSTWHIFYIDTSDTIRQKSNSNLTNIWTDGPITSLNLKAYGANQASLQACWYGSFYGDADYAHTPLSNAGNSTTSSSEVGMHLWYATDATTIQQYGWRQGDDTWAKQDVFNDKQGHAGVGCYSWGPGTVTYVMMVNAQNTLEIWWKDTNTSIKATDEHPINQWTNASVAVPNVWPSTSLGYTNFMYAQMDDLSIMGYNVSWGAENTTIVDADTFAVGGDSDPILGLPGTHMSVSAIPDSSGGNSLIVFYQTDGTDITEFVRDITSGAWTQTDLPIPDS